MTNYIVLLFAYYIEALTIYIYFNGNYNAKFKPALTILAGQGFMGLSFLLNIPFVVNIYIGCGFHLEAVEHVLSLRYCILCHFVTPLLLFIAGHIDAQRPTPCKQLPCNLIICTTFANTSCNF